MRTIRIPKNLHYLTDKLPRPNYGNNESSLLSNSNHTLSNSPKAIKHDRHTTGTTGSVSKSSLPKLSQIVRGVGHSPSHPYQNGSSKRKNKYNKAGDMLMI